MGAGHYKKTKVLPYRLIFNNEIDDVVLLAAQNEEQQSFDGKSNYEGLNLQVDFHHFLAKFSMFQSNMASLWSCSMQKATLYSCMFCFACHSSFASKINISF